MAKRYLKVVSYVILMDEVENASECHVVVEYY